MLISNAGTTRLCRPIASLIHPLLVPGNQHAPTCSGNDLITVERKCPDVSPCAGKATLVRPPQRFRRVLYQLDSVFTAAIQNRLQIRALPEEINHNHGSWQPVPGSSAPESVFQQIRVHIPSLAIRIDEHWLRAEISDGIGRGNKGQVLAEHFISGLDANQPKSKMDGRGATAQGYGWLTHQCCKL